MDSQARDQTSRTVAVSLLHGTWGRGFFPRARSEHEPPRWFESSSQFAASLNVRLRNSNVTCVFVEPVQWSGGNSLTARSNAVADVIASMKQVASVYPGIVRVVIAHSHGGNIAMRAIEEIDVGCRPAGLATLSTPFIVTEERGFTVAESLMLFCLALFVAFGPFFYFGMPFMEGVGSRVIVNAEHTWEETRNFLLSIVYGLCVAGLTLLMIRKSAQMTVSAMRMSPRVSEGTDLLVIRATGDEASMALALGDLIERTSLYSRMVVTKLFAVVEQLVKRKWPIVERAFWHLGWYSILAVGSVATYLIMYERKMLDDPRHFYLWLSFSPMLLVLAPLFIVGIVMCLGAILGAFLMGVSACASIGYGFEYAWLGWKVRTTCEATPRGVTVPVHGVSFDYGMSLAHGVYNSPETVEVLAQWIEGLVERHVSNGEVT